MVSMLSSPPQSKVWAMKAMEEKRTRKSLKSHASSELGNQDSNMHKEFQSNEETFSQLNYIRFTQEPTFIQLFPSIFWTKFYAEKQEQSSVKENIEDREA
ncbi:hypothetical protein ACFX13_008424 [Malus domestica]